MPFRFFAFPHAIAEPHGYALTPEKFQTSKVENMTSMFGNCRSLVLLDVSGFDTSSVTQMNTMFMNCKSLPILDLSVWDYSQVASHIKMLAGSSMEDIYGADGEGLFR